MAAYLETRKSGRAPTGLELPLVAKPPVQAEASKQAFGAAGASARANLGRSVEASACGAAFQSLIHKSPVGADEPTRPLPCATFPPDRDVERSHAYSPSRCARRLGRAISRHPRCFPERTFACRKESGGFSRSRQSASGPETVIPDDRLREAVRVVLGGARRMVQSKKPASSSPRYFLAASASISRPSPGASSSSTMLSFTICDGRPITRSSHQGSEALGYSNAI